VHYGESGTFYAWNQVQMIGIGLVAMLFLSYFDYHKFFNKYLALGSFGASFILLVLVLVPGSGVVVNGARRWIKFPGIPQFQPSELMKFAVILSFSYLITIAYSKMKTFKTGVLMFGIPLGAVAFLMMRQPHLSGTILICLIGRTLMFVGGIRWKHIAALGIASAGGLGAAVLLMIATKQFTYFEARFQSWLDPFADTHGNTWQTCQSLIAIGSGGLLGLGLGESRQKFMYLPEAQNDFVFAIVCEELGFIGAVVVVLLFVLLVFRGLFIAAKAPDKFGMLMAVGLTVQIGIQAFLNIAVVSNLIPNTGISLPFFSYGGTAIVMQLAQMGILCNISRQAKLE